MTVFWGKDRFATGLVKVVVILLRGDNSSSGAARSDNKCSGDKKIGNEFLSPATQILLDRISASACFMRDISHLHQQFFHERRQRRADISFAMRKRDWRPKVNLSADLIRTIGYSMDV